MQVVLYTDDMEAITVIDLPQWFLERLHDGQVMRVAVEDSAPPTWPSADAVVPVCKFYAVSIWAERFVRNGGSTWLLFTRDEELALLLRSSVLPGQRRDYQDEFKRGFIKGLLSTLN